LDKFQTAVVLIRPVLISDEDRNSSAVGMVSRAPKELSLSTGTKMLVSNLGPEVTDEDLEELFTENGGPVKKAEVFYSKDGTSTGTAVS
jgi:RNA recognition motif-containing protein